MNLQHLRYFLVVAEKENMREAAEELLVAQPSLSKCISALEDELGVELFDRKKKRLKLNASGRFFYNNISMALASIDDCVRETRKRANEETKSINLLAFSPSTLFISDLLMHYYRDGNNSTRVNLQKYHSNIFDVEGYDVILFSEENVNCKRLVKDSIPLLTEPICWAVNKNHPLAGRESIKLSELNRERFVVPSREFFSRLRIEEKLDEVLPDFDDNVVFYSNSPVSVMTFIENDVASSFVPAISWQFLRSDKISLIPVEDWSTQRTIYLYSQDESVKREEIDRFIAYSKRYIEELVKTRLSDFPGLRGMETEGKIQYR